MDSSSIDNKRFDLRLINDTERIERICYANLSKLYGKNIPRVASGRLSTELAVIATHSFATPYLIAHKIVDFSHKKGYRTSTRGDIGSSLTAYLLELTEINPLPAHYRCPKCFFSDFENVDRRITCYELPIRNCPKCGSRLIADGMNILPELSMGIKYDKEPNITINLAPEILRHTIYMLRHWLKTEEPGGEIIGAGVSVKLEDGTIRKGVHPGGLFIVPSDVCINEITRLRDDVRDDGIILMVTEENYSYVEKYMKKYDVLSLPQLGLLHDLEEVTGFAIDQIPLDDQTITEAMSHHPILYFGDKTGVGNLVYNVVNPSCFEDLVKMEGLTHASFIDSYNIEAEQYIRIANELCFTCRDDILEYLLFKGLDIETAYKTMRQVAVRGRRLTDEMIFCLKEHGINERIIGMFNKIRYLYPRAQTASYALMNWRLTYLDILMRRNRLNRLSEKKLKEGKDEFDIEEYR